MAVDHFHNISKYAPHTNATFKNRYWFDASHYKKGGPVIILQSGEADGTERLGFLQTGLIQQIALENHGIAVIFEHRYYGTSMPTPDLSTESLRFLTTEQAMADEAYFAQNVVFPGLEHVDLTSKTTAWIGYGGSYAGAFNAFLRVQYSDIFWGTISSSGVTKAIYDYWEYYEPIATYGPPDCISAQKRLINVVDVLLLKNDTHTVNKLKTVFGLQNITYNDDFANILSTDAGLGYWQSLNWDPALTSDVFYEYCDAISNTSVVYPATANKTSVASSLIEAAGYNCTTDFVNQMLNFIGYIEENVVVTCKETGDTQDQCYSGHNATYYAQDDITQDWRSWPYQYCTQWGFLQTGSGVPADQLPLISRLLDLPYESLICKLAFNITSPPDLEAVNKYGGYDIAYERLAIIGGEWDPWRPATPQAYGYGAKNRTSTVNQPDILIPKAVHHWDENGVFLNQTNSTFPPQSIQKTQMQERAFVKAWMEEWRYEHDVLQLQL
ncbi:hypothetical protein LTR08_006816 [Meristemomyces frigidus]|nr:hypothetical protein LTR08_006816 [Meristemomyces frigidus]